MQAGVTCLPDAGTRNCVVCSRREPPPQDGSASGRGPAVQPAPAWSAGDPPASASRDLVPGSHCRPRAQHTSSSDTDLPRSEPGGDHAEEPVPLLGAQLAEQGLEHQGRHLPAGGRGVVHHGQTEWDKEQAAVLVQQALGKGGEWAERSGAGCAGGSGHRRRRARVPAGRRRQGRRPSPGRTGARSRARSWMGTAARQPRPRTGPPTPRDLPRAASVSLPAPRVAPWSERGRRCAEPPLRPARECVAGTGRAYLSCASRNSRLGRSRSPSG